HDATAAVGKLDGFDVCVGEAAGLVGKRVKVTIQRVLDGTAYATLVRKTGKTPPEPLTAGGEAEKPTRKPPARKVAGALVGAEAEEGLEVAEDEDGLEEAEVAAEPLDAEAEADDAEPVDGEAAPAKKRTRRGSRGGKNRRKRTAAAQNGAPAAPNAERGDERGDEAGDGAVEETVDQAPESVEEPATNGSGDDWGYVPMSEWGDEFKP